MIELEGEKCVNKNVSDFVNGYFEIGGLFGVTRANSMLSQYTQEL